jgi:hypothetical protein
MSIGMTITVAPLTTTVMSSVEKRHTGTASGINNAISRTAGLLTIAVMGIVMLNVFSSNLQQQLTLMKIPSDIRQAVEAQSIKLAGIVIPQGTNSQLHTTLQQAIDESFVSGFRTAVLICAGLALLSAFVSWAMIDGKKTDHGPE